MRRVQASPTSARFAAIDPVTRLRFTRLIVAALFIVAQGLGLLHLAHVRHAPCAEHGGMRHVEAGHGRHAAVAPGALAVEVAEVAPQAGRSGTGETDHGHEDCSSCARERHLGLAAAVVEFRAPVFVPNGVARRVGPGRVDVDQAGRWRLAPKQGPPTLG